MRLGFVLMLAGFALLAAGCSDLTDEDRGEQEQVTSRAGDESTPLIELGSGDVQVTLEWDNPVDLDLWVTGPDGDRVWFGNAASPGGGRLDADNRCDGLIPGRPENIFWPQGDAPAGTYTVEIDYFNTCDSGGDAEWRIITRVQGEAAEYEGTIAPGDTIEVVVIEVEE